MTKSHGFSTNLLIFGLLHHFGTFQFKLTDFGEDAIIEKNRNFVQKHSLSWILEEKYIKPVEFTQKSCTWKVWNYCKLQFEELTRQNLTKLYMDIYTYFVKYLTKFGINSCIMDFSKIQESFELSKMATPSALHVWKKLLIFGQLWPRISLWFYGIKFPK